MTTRILQGILRESVYADDGDVFYLSGHSDPLIHLLGAIKPNLEDGFVYLRYWVFEVEPDSGKVVGSPHKEVSGELKMDLYLEETGLSFAVLEELTVGGNDLLAELIDHVGKWVIFEIDHFMTVPVNGFPSL